MQLIIEIGKFQIGPASSIASAHYLPQLWNSTKCWTLDKEYFDLLSGLGVNQNIVKAWRTIPTCFPGVGLPDLMLETTIARINTFLQHFLLVGCIGTALSSASLKYLQLEIGTNKFPLMESYDDFQMVATCSWVKAFWEGLHRFGVNLRIQHTDIPLPRERDKLLRNMFLEAG